MSRPLAGQRQHGFTLLELILALLIFGILAVGMAALVPTIMALESTSELERIAREADSCAESMLSVAQNRAWGQGVVVGGVEVPVPDPFCGCGDDSLRELTRSQNPAQCGLLVMHPLIGLVPADPADAGLCVSPDLRVLCSDLGEGFYHIQVRSRANYGPDAQNTFLELVVEFTP